MTDNPITSEQRKQFERFVEDACNRGLKEVDLDKDGLQRIIERGGEFQGHIINGIRQYSAASADYSLAQSILGENFVTPEEISKTCGVCYGNPQLKRFADTLPSEEELRWCKKNEYAIIAGQPTGSGIPCTWNGPPPITGWLAVRKTPVPNSMNKTLNSQRLLLSHVEDVPEKLDMEWFLNILFRVRGMRLLQGRWVRTSINNPDTGYCILVGAIGAGNYMWSQCEAGSHNDSVVGLAAMRNLQPSL